jgi:hypothetical protein
MIQHNCSSKFKTKYMFYNEAATRAPNSIAEVIGSVVEAEVVGSVVEAEVVGSVVTEFAKTKQLFSSSEYT